MEFADFRHGPGPGHQCAYGYGTFVIVSMQGTILSSTNGVGWTTRYSGVYNLLLGIAFGGSSPTNRTFIAVGDAGTIFQSDPIPPLWIWRQPQSQTVTLGQTAWLGAGTRISGGWQRAGLPALPTSTIRARGFVTGGEYISSGWFVESTMPFVPQTPPTILVNDGYFGFLTNQFGFNVAGVAGQTVVIETSTNLVNWRALVTNVLGAGPVYFSDPDSTNVPACFYRARLQ